MADIIKINLKDEENKRNWDLFVEKCLTACVNRNKNDSKFKYLLRYEYDSIEIVNAKEDGGLYNELKSVSLEKDEYIGSDAPDNIIIDRLLNTIQVSPNTR